MDSLQAVLYVYLFIVLGFLTKKIFGQKVDEKTLVVLSVYIFQPFLSFWGLLKRPIDLDLVAFELFGRRDIDVEALSLIQRPPFFKHSFGQISMTF